MPAVNMDVVAREAKDEGADYFVINGVLACSFLFPVLATGMVCYKVYVRRLRKRFAADDWLIIASLPLLYLTAGTAIFTVYRGGLGRSVDASGEQSPNTLITAIKAFLAVEFFYLHALTVIKLSLLAMYRNIFPTRWVHVSTCCIAAMCIAWWFAMFILTFIQCRPLRLMWDTNGNTDGSCLDRFAVLYSNAIPHIVINGLILSLPLREVVRLQMNWSKKLGVFVLFLLGGIAVIVSCLRLNSGLYSFYAPADDYTIAVGSVWMWTVVELAIGIICACLPIVGGPMVGKFITMISSPKRSVAKHSESKANKRRSVYTIGGSSSKGIKRPALAKSKRESGFFERLGDESESRRTGLWPKGYHSERHTTVSGRRPSSDGSDDIPLARITIRKELTWTETKIDELEMHKSSTGALDVYDCNNGVLDMPRTVVRRETE